MKSAEITLPFFDYEIFSAPLESFDFLENHIDKVVVNTINPHSFYIADHDFAFKKALIDSTILLPDGIGIVYSNLMINKKVIKKIAGNDIFHHLLTLAEKSSDKRNKRVFFFGSTEDVLVNIKCGLEQDYPSLLVGYYSPPFQDEFSEGENRKMVGLINEFSPFLLFVGMTAPKQEKWVNANARFISASVLCSIGAVFDFYSGKISRPGKAWQMLGLEWLGRLAREPKRMWRRSLVSLPYFIHKTMLQIIKNLSPR